MTVVAKVKNEKETTVNRRETCKTTFCVPEFIWVKNEK